MTLQSIDTELLRLVNGGMANAVFDIIMPALSRRGYLLVIPFLILMFLRGSNRQNDGGKSYFADALVTFLIACAAVYLAVWVEDWVKIAVARERPCRAVAGLRLLIPCPKSYSLPSGHAITSFACATPLFYLTRNYLAMTWRLYPLVLAAAIAVSRLYLGVHYPTDVLAGGLLGAAIGAVLSLLYEVIATGKFVNGNER